MVFLKSYCIISLSHFVPLFYIIKYLKCFAVEISAKRSLVSEVKGLL